MENHPIPQDVTGFQFKLVGNMTIKQFGYVAAGILLSVFLYYMPLPGYIQYPSIFLLVTTGLAFAFLPIEGRSMDVMTANFFKAILHPNQFIYQKVGGKLSFSDLNLAPVVVPTSTVQPTFNPRRPMPNDNKEEKLRAFLNDMSTVPSSPLDQEESKYLNLMFGSATVLPVQQPAIQAQPTPPYIPPAPETTQQYTAVQPTAQVQVPMQQVVVPTPMQTQPMAMPVMPEPPMNPPSPMVHVQETPVTPAAPALPQVQSTSTIAAVAPQSTAQPQEQTFVHAIGKDEAMKVGVPHLPGVPNLISGIVKDPRGNVLSGILVEVKNKDGDSVRAFKTNTLGQFVSATQLMNGLFTVTFEDPRGQHKFQSIQIETNGTILPSLEVISMDDREELRRSLFG